MADEKSESEIEVSHWHWVFNTETDYVAENRIHDDYFL